MEMKTSFNQVATPMEPILLKMLVSHPKANSSQGTESQPKIS